MEGRIGFLVCLICSFCLIYGGEAALGDGCTDNSNCTTSDAECNGTSEGSVCICSSGFFKSGALCSTDVGLGDTCPTTIPNTEPCADDNARCNNEGKCTCMDTYYNSNGAGNTGGQCIPELGLGGNCPTTIPNSEPCADNNAMCSTEGKCTCMDTYYNSNGAGNTGGQCTPVVGLGDTCPTTISNTEPCADNNARCSTEGKCICMDTFFNSNGAGNTGGQCIPEVGLGDICPTTIPNTEPCADNNARCSTEGKCICMDTFYNSNGAGNTGGQCIPEKGLGEICPTTISNTEPCADDNTRCSTGGKCTCIDTFYNSNGAGNTGGQCTPEVGLGDTCPTTIPNTEPCADNSAMCSIEGKCICMDTYYNSNGAGNTGGQCIPEVGLGDNCPTTIPNSEPCADNSAMCSTEGKCICMDTYYNSNGAGNTGGQCTPEKGLGEICPTTISNTEPCADDNARCSTGGKCTCIDTFYNSNGAGNTGGQCTPEVGLGDTCPTTIPNTEPCADNSAMCSIEGKCICMDTYYNSNGAGNTGGQCIPEVGLGDNCPTTIPNSEPCADNSAMCSTEGKCICMDTYYNSNGAGNTGGQCTPEKGLGEICPTTISNTEPCADDNARCSTGGKCTCIDTFYNSNGAGNTGGQCTPEVGLGDTCPTTIPNTEPCADNSAMCSIEGKCICMDTYYNSNGAGNTGGQCIPEVGLGDNCPTTIPNSEPCADNSAMCSTEGKCICMDTYYNSNGAGNTGGQCTPEVGLGNNCPTTIPNSEPCSDDNARCTGLKCTCKDTFYNSNGAGSTGGKCTPEVGLGEICPTTIPNSEPCADDNAMCSTEGKCTCMDTFYNSNGAGNTGGQCTPEVGLGEICPTTLPNSEPCADDNARCTGGTCTCMDTFYNSNGAGNTGGQCTPEVGLGNNCPTTIPNSEPCADDNARCTGGKCTCKDTFYNSNGADSTGGQCTPEVGLGNNCPQSIPNSEPCADDNARCTGGKCTCMDTYYNSNGADNTGGQCTPEVGLGDTCPTDISNSEPCADNNARCTGGKCTCINTYYDDNGAGNIGGLCTPKVAVGAACPVPTVSVPTTATCADSNARCTLFSSNYICSCLDSYYSYNGICNAKLGLGDTCPTGISDSEPCADNNAKCSTGGKCTCMDTFYDSNSVSIRGGQCTLKKGLGETCPTDIPDSEPCTDNNARCTGACTCKDTYYNSNGAGNTGGQCTPEVNLGSPCTMTEACGTPNAVCENSECVCGDDFYDDNGSQPRGTCTLKIQLNQGCTYSFTITDQCSDRNAECRYYSGADRCVCKNSYSESGGQCNPNQRVGGDCFTGGAGACSDGNAVCIGNKCICNINTYDDNGLTLGGDCRLMTELQVSVPFTSSPATTGFTVVWTAPEKSQHVSGYTLQWRPKDNSVGGGSVDVGNATSNVISAEVTAGKAYVVTVVSRNEVTQQNAPRTITSLSKEQALKPNKPGNIIQGASNFDAEDKKIRVAWNSAVGSVSGYIVMLLLDGKELASESVTFTQRDIYYVNMLNGHRYTISITSLSESFAGGDKVESEVYVEEIKTIVKVPGPPRDVKCAQETEEMIRLTWLPPTLPNGDIIWYHIRVIKPDSSEYSVHRAGPDKTTSDIGGLQPGSYYKFEMTTENELYNSSTIGFTASFCTTTARVSDPPSGFAVKDVTSRSVAFEWSDPVNTYSKENLGYLVQVKDDNGNCKGETIYRCSDCKQTFSLSDLKDLCDSQGPVTAKTSSQLSGTQVYNATGLNPDIQYTVSVTAISIEGKGKTATVTQKTAEEVPAKPEITIRAITTTSFTVDWSIADPRPGNTTYEITVDTKSPAQAKTTTITGFSRRTTMIDGLEENWQYTVSVSARTSVGSQTSAEESILTKPSAPGKVDDFKVDRVPGGSYNEWKVTWKIPLILERNSNITSYRFIHNGTTDLQNKMLNTQVESHLYVETIGVEPENFYSVEVYAVNVNGQNGESVIYFDESLASVPEEDKTSIGMIVGIVVAVVVLIIVGLLVGLFIMRRRRNKKAMRPIDEELPKIDPTSIQRKRPKRLSEFNEYLEKMHTDSNLQFSAEFEDIKALSAQHSQDASNKDENKLKNRYINILPFDHSLVKLSSNGENDCQDYINANYLPGYKSQREYIGCQGPIPGTIDDFWRMIWEQNVSVVVMLTLCKEGKKVKCEQYWPDKLKKPKQYGDIIVEVQSYSNTKTYDYRIFTLIVGNKAMIVKHFRFLSWMDFSANAQTVMIDFIKQVRSHVQPPDTAGPIIVHCNAGVGRTGTYITLDHLMQFVEDHDVSDSSVDIFDMVLSLRENRPHMVQTEQQYIFIHDCLKEIIEKKQQSQVYQKLVFEGEENIYQNQETIPMYESLEFGQEPRTNL